MFYKIDLCMQCLIGILTLLATSFFPLYFLIGLFCIGVWQLASALVNTLTVNHYALFSKCIKKYWLAVAGNFMGWGLLMLLNGKFQVIGFWALIGMAIYIAVKYALLVNELIKYNAIKSELDTVVRENHF
jgi:hypothetical protein